ncbi:MAG: hypothetical protein ACE5JG_05660 [Planctomycetota bacterium]
MNQLLYLFFGAGATLTVGWALFRNGGSLLADAYGGDRKLATAMNRLLGVSFHLFNFGCLLRSMPPDQLYRAYGRAPESLAHGSGRILLVLAVIYLIHLGILARIRSNAGIRCRGRRLVREVAVPPRHPPDS